MIGVRTPFRISLIGGTSDLPEYYKEFGGKVISTSINKYMYHFIHKYSASEIQIKYSKTEIVKNKKEIKHPIVKAISEIYGIEGLDINSIADIPKGTGLASSSAYTVGLINGLANYHNQNLSKSDLAKLACKVELNILNEPIGKQDQYATAFGGFNKIIFNKNDSVRVKQLSLSNNGFNYLNSCMVLYKTNISRNASDILYDQKKGLKQKVNKDYVHEIVSLVKPMEDALKDLNIKKMGEILTENWEVKKKLSKSVTNNQIDKMNKDLLSQGGIYGSKLLGAGGGGYLLLIGEPKKISTLSGESFQDFRFDNTGSKIVYQD